MTSTCYPFHHGHMGLSATGRLTFRSFCSLCASCLTLPWPKGCFCFKMRSWNRTIPRKHALHVWTQSSVTIIAPFVPAFQKYFNRQTCQQRCYRHPPRNKHTPCVCCSLSNLNSTAGISNSKSLQISSSGWAIIFNLEIRLNSKLIPQNHDLLVKSEMGEKEDLSAYSLEYFCLWLIYNKTVPRILKPILVHSSYHYL